MKHAKPNKGLNFKNTLLLFFVGIILALAMIFAIFSLYECASSRLSWHEEPLVLGVELVTEEPGPTHPTYFTYNTEETETNG